MFPLPNYLPAVGVVAFVSVFRCLALVLWMGLLILSLPSCLQWRHSDKEMARLFREAQVPLAVHHIKTPNGNLRYVEVRDSISIIRSGDITRTNVLLIHGAPSSLRIWMSYLTDTALTHHVNLYAMDRPGYGYSDFGRADTSILSQADAMISILDRHPGPWVVFGSSYGGPIAAVLAARRPDKVRAMLLTSPSLAPGEEKIYPISYTVRRKALGWFFPAIFRVANAEKLSHKNALAEAVPYYAQVLAPVTYIHGGQDSLIYPSNAAFAKKTFTGTTIKFIRLENRPHFFTYTEQPLIERELRLLSIMDN